MPVRIVPIPAATPPDRPAARQAALAAVRRALVDGQRGDGTGALVCTDGSVAGQRHPRLRRGGWAVTVQVDAAGRAGPVTVSGVVEGLDCSSTCAEREGARVLLEAAAGAGVPFTVYIDNREVQRTLNDLLQGRPRTPEYGFSEWADLEPLARRLPPGCSARWVPSHDKYEGRWQPDDRHSDREVRALNKCADEAAGAASAAAFERHSRVHADLHAAARAGVAASIRRLVAGEKAAMAAWLPSLEEGDIAPAARRRGAGRARPAPAAAVAA